MITRPRTIRDSFPADVVRREFDAEAVLSDQLDHIAKVLAEILAWVSESP